MKKTCFLALILCLTATAWSQVKVELKTEGEPSRYDFIIEGDDLVSFQKVFKNLEDGLVIAFSEPVTATFLEILTTSGTGTFYDVKEVVNDEESPYRKIKSEATGYTYLSFLYGHNSFSIVYDLIDLEPVEDGAKRRKTWKSSDGKLIISCAKNIMPITSTHQCNFKLRIE